MPTSYRPYGWRDNLPGSHNYLAHQIVRIVDEHRPGRILDAGCGNGALAGLLAKRGYDVHGVDGDPGGIEIARRNNPDARFEVGSFDTDPPGKFDFVLSTEVIEHLYTPGDLARYCFKALRPGGTLAISTPYHGYLKNLALSVAGAWDAHFTVGWDGGHIKFWSRATLTKLLTDAGFEVTGFVGSGRLPYLWKSMILIARKPPAA